DAHISKYTYFIHVSASHSDVFPLNDTAPPDIYTLSLHDALPISQAALDAKARALVDEKRAAAERERGDEVDRMANERARREVERSEEHTSELQSPCNLVCRLLLEKKKKKKNKTTNK